MDSYEKRLRTETQFSIIMERFDEMDKKLNKLLSRKDLMNEDDILLDNQDLLFLLGVSRRTLQTYRDANMISYIRISGRVYYKKSDVKEFLNSYKKYRNVKL